MKKLYSVILLVILAIPLHAQTAKMPVDPGSKKVAYQADVKVSEAIMQPALFNRAKAWGSAKKLTEKTARKDLGVYSASGKFTVDYPASVSGKTDRGTVTYNLTITCEDGKYKYVFTDFVHTGAEAKKDGGTLESSKPKCGVYLMPPASWNKIKLQTDQEIKKMISEITDAMAGKTPGK